MINQSDIKSYLLGFKCGYFHEIFFQNDQRKLIQKSSVNSNKLYLDGIISQISNLKVIKKLYKRNT